MWWVEQEGCFFGRIGSSLQLNGLHEMAGSLHEKRPLCSAWHALDRAKETCACEKVDSTFLGVVGNKKAYHPRELISIDLRHSRLCAKTRILGPLAHLPLCAAR